MNKSKGHVSATSEGASSKEANYRDMPVVKMEKIIERFHERVNAAQKAAPATRDWVRESLIHRKGVRCPARGKRLSLDLIVLHGDALADVFCEFPDDATTFAAYEWMIGFQPPGKKDPINTVEALMKESQWVDEWGARWAHAATGVGAIQIEHPLADWAQLDEYLETRMPDPHGPGRLDAAARLMAPLRGHTYSIGLDVLGVLETLRTIRSMEDLFMDFHSAEAEVRRLTDAITDFQIEVLRDWAKIGADCVMFGDDWGMQTGMQIAPAMWRELFKPCYKRMFSAAHAAGLDILFHSCGKVVEIVEDLIEVGVDILDPIQPGCMDPVQLARKHGGRVSFSGAVDIQGIMVFGKPAQVKDEVRRLLDILGTPFGGGFLVGPANSMTPDIPLANIRAMVEACHGR